jgi:anion-transporting  ArsA/GET3 family ATPase
MLDEFQQEVFQRLEAWDQRISKIRQDLDVNKLKKEISKKAPQEEFLRHTESSNIRMNALDGNFQLIANDFVTL